MKEDSFEMLFMANLVLKMEPTTMRELDWQHSSRKHKEVPPCSDLLEFVDLRAHDLENSLRDVVKKSPTSSYPD